MKRTSVIDYIVMATVVAILVWLSTVEAKDKNVSHPENELGGTWSFFIHTENTRKCPDDEKGHCHHIIITQSNDGTIGVWFDGEKLGSAKNHRRKMTDIEVINLSNKGHKQK